MQLSFLQRLVVVAQVQAAVNAISSRRHLVDAESTLDVKSNEFHSAIIPIISLGPWMAPTQDEAARQYVVRQIQEASRSVGFFLVEDHGINSTILSDAWEVMEAFFDMPLHQKQRYITPNIAEYPYGYEQSERLVKGKALDHDDSAADSGIGTPDLKETFSIGPDDLASGVPLRRWIEDNNEEMNFLPRFRNVIEDYYAQMDRLSRLLLNLFALALDQPETFFDDKMDHHMGALRLVHYYPLVPPRNLPDVIRAGAHSDYGSLTILNARDPGLEVYLMEENSSERRWQSVPIVPGTLVINLGDLMQRWTNDKWVSTLHRVLMPSTDDLQQRFSMAYFVNINGDAIVETVDSCKDDKNGQTTTKYGPILARDHLMAKHLASMEDHVIEENKSQISAEKEL